MKASTKLSVQFTLIVVFFGALAACDADHQPQTGMAATPAAETPRPAVFISSKITSSDCGVHANPSPPPGFAEVPGVPLKEMPEAVAGFQAVGADRTPVDTDRERVSPGYVLIEPLMVKESFLINNDKETVATLEGDYFFDLTKLQSDGGRVAVTAGRTEVFRGGGQHGCIEAYSADGDLLWRWNLNDEHYIQHHDFVVLENGNVLAVVWEKVSADEVISLGRNPENVAEDGTFWYDGVIELDPNTGEIVWEWSARHHIVQDFDASKPYYGVVADHPELLDINTFRANPQGGVNADWTHVNAIDYSPELDQIVLSSNFLSEIWIIDHSTTPREAMAHSGGRSGKGGDLLYRWGNPAQYGRGTEDDQKLFRQHDAHWIDAGLPGAGHLMVYNNGDGMKRPYTTVVEIAPEMNPDGSYVLRDGEPYGPETMEWEYDPEPPERFYSHFISGAQRLPNGNTLVNKGAGAKVREVTSSGEIVWDYAYTDDIDAPHMLFRAYRYAADHPAIVGILGNSD